MSHNVNFGPLQLQCRWRKQGAHWKCTLYLNSFRIKRARFLCPSKTILPTSNVWKSLALNRNSPQNQELMFFFFFFFFFTRATGLLCCIQDEKLLQLLWKRKTSAATWARKIKTWNFWRDTLQKHPSLKCHLLESLSTQILDAVTVD